MAVENMAASLAWSALFALKGQTVIVRDHLLGAGLAVGLEEEMVVAGIYLARLEVVLFAGHQMERMAASLEEVDTALVVDPESWPVQSVQPALLMEAVVRWDDLAVKEVRHFRRLLGSVGRLVVSVVEIAVVVVAADLVVA